MQTLFQWIRIKCRHYWLLHGITGFGALYRSSILTRIGKRVSQRNVATYGPGVVVRPLTKDIWSTFGAELSTNAHTPLADSIYCDALLSAVSGDEMKAVLEAGVAAEIALTQLLIEASCHLPDNPNKSEFRKNEGDHHSFNKKLTEWPQRLGFDAADCVFWKGMPPGWVQTAQKLYKLRNSVAHAGKLTVGASVDVQSSILAANAAIEYCRQQRIKVGLSNYSFPPGTTPFDQTMMCHNAFLTAESSNCYADLG